MDENKPKKRGRGRPPRKTKEDEKNIQELDAEKIKKEVSEDMESLVHANAVGVSSVIHNRKRGHRETLYNEEMASKICSLIAAGMTIREISAMEGMPKRATIYVWLGENKSFQERYSMAYSAHYDEMADEILEIADERHVTVDTDEHGTCEVKMDGALVMDKGIRIKARQWILERRAPKKYGNRVEIESNVNIGDASIQRFIEIGEQVQLESQKLYAQICARRERMGLPVIDQNGEEIVLAE